MDGGGLGYVVGCFLFFVCCCSSSMARSNAARAFVNYHHNENHQQGTAEGTLATTDPKLSCTIERMSTNAVPWDSPYFTVVIPYLVNIVTHPGQVVHQGSVVLVTGASSGIGLSAAVALKKKGYFVIGGVRKEKDAVTLRKTYGLQTVILDVTKEVDIERSKQEFNRFVKKSLFVGLEQRWRIRNLPVGGFNLGNHPLCVRCQYIWCYGYD